nr:AEC family transporter [Tissierella sp.]
MDFLVTLQSVSVLFLLIVVGFIVGRVNIISLSGQKELSNFVLKVTMPATIILALQFEFTKERFTIATHIIAIAIVAYLAMILLAKFMRRFYKLDEAQRDIAETGMVLPNTSFMGYPIVLSLLGEEALFYAVLGTGLIFEIVGWTYGAYMINRSTGGDFKKNLVKNILFSPGIVSIIIGFSLFIFSITIPEPINTTMRLLSGATSPLAMIVVGILLSRSNIKECLTNTKLYFISITRLLIFPMLLFFGLKMFGFTGMKIIIPVMMLSTPTAAYVAIFAGNANNNTKLASQIVFVSSLLSLITIPIMVYLVMSV